MVEIPWVVCMSRTGSDNEVEWSIQVVGLGKAPTSGVYLTGLTDKFPIVLPPEAAYSFDKHNQDEYTDNAECKSRYGEHGSINSDNRHEDRGQPPLERMCHWLLMKQASMVYQFQSMDIYGVD